MAEAKLWVNTRGGYPACLKQTTKSPPAQLAPTQVQMRIRAAALNPVDVQLMNLPFWSLPFLGYEKGVGCDMAGTILRVGPEVKHLKEGDEVMGLHLNPGGVGALAEVETFDINTTPLVKKPQDWSWQQAAALPLVWLTARTSIESVASYVNQTKTVAVLGGSSSTGIYSVWLAKQRGWRVVASCSGKNTDFVRSIGADETVDYTKESVRDSVKAAKPDAIIDCVGGTECLGIAKRFVTIVGDKTSRSLMGGSFSYLITPMMNIRWALGRLGLGEVYDCIELKGEVAWLEEAKKLSRDKIFIDSEFGFNDAKQAFERLNTGRARGKVIVNID